MLAQGSDKDFVAPRIPKSDGVHDLLHRSIRQKVLFQACAEEELRNLVASSDEAQFAAGAVVIRQGDGVTSSVSSRRGRLMSRRRLRVPTAPPPPRALGPDRRPVRGRRLL